MVLAPTDADLRQGVNVLNPPSSKIYLETYVYGEFTLP
jgi:hypothetical protein